MPMQTEDVISERRTNREATAYLLVHPGYRNAPQVSFPVPVGRNQGESFMIITTTPSIEGKQIRAYLGVVTGEAIMGANLFKDLFAGIRDLVGGRSATYERELRRARQVALKELEERATALGADSVVGVDIDYEVLGQNNGMLMVSVSGTAVKTG